MSARLPSDHNPRTKGLHESLRLSVRHRSAMVAERERVPIIAAADHYNVDGVCENLPLSEQDTFRPIHAEQPAHDQGHTDQNTGIDSGSKPAGAD